MADSQYELANTIMGGRLRRWLIAQRDAGLSYQRIAAKLGYQYDISVTDETVRRWCLEHLPEHV